MVIQIAKDSVKEVCFVFLMIEWSCLLCIVIVTTMFLYLHKNDLFA